MWRVPLKSTRDLSRFGEVIIGRSGEFAELMTPPLQRCLGEQPAFMSESVRRLNYMMKPGFIRIVVDEVCYPTSVVTRLEIERAIEGGLEPV